jgi:hypothetical protein
LCKYASFIKFKNTVICQKYLKTSNLPDIFDIKLQFFEILSDFDDCLAIKKELHVVLLNITKAVFVS